MSKTSKRRLLSVCVALSVMFSLLSVSHARELHYYYVEAENYQENCDTAFRDEGFTTWMGHPSGGRTVIYGSQRAFVKYDLSKLPDGEYSLFIRHLAFPKPQASVEAFVLNESTGNESLLGVTGFDTPGTYLAWCQKLGPFRKQGKTFLTVRPAPGNIQAPYLDVLLVTNDPDFIPDNLDQDFQSATVLINENDVSFSDFSLHNVVGKTYVSLSARNNSGVARTVTARVSGVNPVTRESCIAQQSVTLKPGSEMVKVGFQAPSNKKYVLTTEVLDDRNQMLFRKVSPCLVLDPIDIKLNGAYFSEGEDLRIALKVNDADLLSAQPSVVVSVGKRGSRVVFLQKKVEVHSAATEIAMTVQSLPVGKYEVLVRLVGPVKFSRELEVCKINLPEEKLEDIKQVWLRDRALWVNGKPFVPRKLYHAGGTKAVKAQGFNCVDCWGGDTLEGVEKMLDEAHANNLYGYGILFHPFFFKGLEKGFDREALIKGINRLKNHPALLLYELYDEPDVNVPLKFMQEAYSLIRELDPNHPVELNFCRPDKYKEYAVAADMISMDRYPVPGVPLTTVSDYMDKLDAAADAVKPMQAVLQTYGDIKGRMPTPEELRCMTYLAINHGARSLAFYSYAEGKDYPYCLAADPILWSYMRNLNRELIALRDAVVAPALQSRASASISAIDLSARRVGERLFLITVNKENKTVSAMITVQDAVKLKKVETLFEDRSLRLQGAGHQVLIFTDSFKPYEVHVYEMR